MATRRLVLPAETPADVARGSIFFVGTATVLIRYAGFTLLTDPNFLHRGQHVRLGYGLRSRRLTDPALAIEQLPPVDAVLLSHLHEDHFDRVAEERLPRSLPVVTTPHAADSLSRKGFFATQALATWETFECVKGDARLRITATPGRHGPRLVCRLLPPVMGALLEFERGTGEHLLRIYITGDTLVTAALREIPARYPDIDVALLHLGGTRILGILVTMDARQGIEILRLTSPRAAIPIHYNDYTVFRSPLGDFARAAQEAGLADRVRYLTHGQTYDFDVPESRRALRRPA